MSKHLVFASLAAAFCVATAPAATNTAPDAGLYTNFAFDSTFANVNYEVCGAVTGSTGCYGSGTLGPFGKVGAMLAADPIVDTVHNTVTRDVYVVDQASAGSTTVKLAVYRFVDTISAPTASVTATRVKTLTLPLTGGTTSRVFMAASDSFVFIGTSLSASYVKVAKTAFAMTTLSGASGAGAVSAITSDNHGFVTVDHQNSMFDQRDPSGALINSGGGVWHFLNDVYGLTTSHLPAVAVAADRAALSSPRMPRTATSAPDSGLYTSYSFDAAFRTFNLTVCGNVGGISGCIGRGGGGPFGRIGALVEGIPIIDNINQVVTRDIYIVDQAVNAGKTMRLYVFRMVETINVDAPLSIVVSQVKVVPLPLTGGLNAKTHIAGTARNLFIGTDQGSGVAVVAKTGFAIRQLHSGGVNATTADPYGFAGIDFASKSFETFRPNGTIDSSGAGSWFVLNTRLGVSTADLPATGAASVVPQLGLHYTKAPQR